MIIEAEQQIKFEEADAFKRSVVYPLLVSEIEKMSVPEGLVTLHLGVGSGLEVCQVSEGHIRKAILVDKNKEVLEVAEIRLENKKIPILPLVEDITNVLPIQFGTVDLAIASFVLNQIKDPKPVFDNVQKYLKKSGKFLVAVPNDQFIVFCSSSRPNRLSEPVVNVSERKIVKYIFSGVDLKADLYVRPNQDYLDLMKAAGFDIEISEHLYDSVDDSIGVIPKGYLLVGRKV